VIVAGLDGEGGSRQYVEVTVHSPSASIYVLTELDKFTRYELRVQPFYGTVDGADSNLVRFQTAPDSQSRHVLSTSYCLFDNVHSSQYCIV